MRFVSRSLAKTHTAESCSAKTYSGQSYAGRSYAGEARRAHGLPRHFVAHWGLQRWRSGTRLAFCWLLLTGCQGPSSGEFNAAQVRLRALSEQATVQNAEIAVLRQRNAELQDQLSEAQQELARALDEQPSLRR